MLYKLSHEVSLAKANFVQILGCPGLPALQGALCPSFPSGLLLDIIDFLRVKLPVLNVYCISPVVGQDRESPPLLLQCSSSIFLGLRNRFYVPECRCADSSPSLSQNPEARTPNLRHVNQAPGPLHTPMNSGCIIICTRVVSLTPNLQQTYSKFVVFEVGEFFMCLQFVGFLHCFPPRAVVTPPDHKIMALLMVLPPEQCLAHANVAMEWLSRPKQDKVYLPTEPFAHQELARRGQLHVFPSVAAPEFGCTFPGS